MTQTIINLDSQIETFVNMFKAQKGLRSKNDAVVRIIKEFKELKKQEYEEKMLGIECATLSQASLAKNWLSKEDDEAFSYLQ